MVLGILGVCVWPLAYLGFPVNLAALGLGILQLRRRHGGMAIAGAMMGAIGLGLTIANLTMGLLDLILKRFFMY
jgi:hypothetical protein